MYTSTYVCTFYTSDCKNLREIISMTFTSLLSSSVFQSDNSHFFANVTFYQQVCENKINFKGTDI